MKEENAKTTSKAINWSMKYLKKEQVRIGMGEHCELFSGPVFVLSVGFPKGYIHR